MIRDVVWVEFDGSVDPLYIGLIIWKLHNKDFIYILQMLFFYNNFITNALSNT